MARKNFLHDLIGSQSDALSNQNAESEPARTSDPGSVAAVPPVHARSDAKPRSTRSDTKTQMSIQLERDLYERLRECAHRQKTKMTPLILEGIVKVLAERERGQPQ